MPDVVEVQDFRARGEARTHAAGAGMRAAVPTRPGWTVADLVIPHGLVRRRAAVWAAVRRGVDECSHPDPWDDGAIPARSAWS